MIDSFLLCTIYRLSIKLALNGF